MLFRSSWANNATVTAGGYTYDYSDHTQYPTLQSALDHFTNTDYPANKSAIDSGPTVNWRYNSDDSNSNNLRGEVNSKNQQFIENATSYRQVLRDASQTLQNYLSQTNDGLQQQSNLLTSIIQSLSTVMQAIVSKSS